MNENVLAMKAAIVAFFTAMGTFLGWKGIMILAWVSLMILDYFTQYFNSFPVSTLYLL